MHKRRRDTDSSLSSCSDDPTDPSFTLDYGEAKKKWSGQPPLAKESHKKTRSVSTVSGGSETSPVASTSAQLQRELGFIVKNEPEECDVDVEQTHDQLTDSPQDRMDRASSAASHESNPGVNRSRRERVWSKVERYQCQWTSSKDPNQPPRPKKAPGPKPHEKYYEGCLVMGWVNIRGVQYWPGMIRKAGAEDDRDHGYNCISDGDIYFYVQFFIDETTCYWRIPGDMRVFDPDRPNRCNHRDPFVVAEFEKGIRIAKAAFNFSVEARLIKFTLPEDARLGGLLRKIDRWNARHASQDDSVPHEENEAALPTELNSMHVLQNDSVGENEVAPPTGLGSEELNAVYAPQNGSVAQDEVSQALLAQRNRRSITDVVAGLKKKDREREEAIKALKTDNSKLATDYSKLAEELEKVKTANRDLTLRLQSVDVEKGKIESLEGKLKDKDKLVAELREDNEKMRSEVLSLEELLDVDTTEDGTGT